MAVCSGPNHAAAVKALPLSLPSAAAGGGGGGGKPWKLLLAGAQGDSAAALLGNYAESASVGQWGSSILAELRAALVRNASETLHDRPGAGPDAGEGERERRCPSLRFHCWHASD